MKGTVVIETTKEDPLLGSQSQSKINSQPNFIERTTNYFTSFFKEKPSRPITFFVNPTNPEEVSHNKKQGFKSNSISTTK